MTIETKFNIGDEVWLMESNKAQQTVVYQINIVVHPSNYVIQYQEKGYTNWYNEDQLFPSKESLLQSL
jgi:hypothetical protein